MSRAELFISQKTEKYLKQCLSNPGHWVHFSKDDCGGHRIEIYDRVRQMLKLMSIRYSVPVPFPAGAIDYGHPIKIKVQAQTTPSTSSSKVAPRGNWRDSRYEELCPDKDFTVPII